MTPLDEAYYEIIDPINFIKKFPTWEHFMEWARGNMINDLKEAIRIFEHYQLYEHCGIMQSVIDEKIDEMLDGLGFSDE